MELLLYDLSLGAVDYCANKSFKRRMTLLQALDLETIQDKITSTDKGSTGNNNNNKVHHKEDLEHKRQLFLEILKQRKIFIDSETGKLINADTDIQIFTYYRKEQEKDMMKAKATNVALLNPDRLVVMKMLQQYYTVPYNLWYRSYCSARDLLSELTMTWLLLLAINPITGWFFHPFVFGWTQ
jgi:hypothetical protein